MQAVAQIWAAQNAFVKFVAFADPPTVSDTYDGKIVTLPHGWASSAAEKIIGAKLMDIFGEKYWGEIIDATWHPKGGLAICGKVKLARVFDISQHRNEAKLMFTSLCASIEYVERRGYCSDVICNELIPVRAEDGCNPGGLIVFPNAPKFSRLIYEARRKRLHRLAPSKYRLFCESEKMTLKLAAKLFPNEDFTCNDILNDFTNTAVAAFHRWKGMSLYSKEGKTVINGYQAGPSELEVASEKYYNLVSPGIAAIRVKEKAALMRKHRINSRLIDRDLWIGTSRKVQAAI